MQLMYYLLSLLILAYLMQSVSVISISFGPKTKILQIDAFVEVVNDLSLTMHLAPMKFPELGFFPDLIEITVTMARKYGSFHRELLKEIKNGAVLYSQLSDQIKDHRQSASMQFVLFAVMTWTFILFTVFMLEHALSFGVVAVVLILQIFGAAFYFLFLNYRIKKLNNYYKNLIKKIYLFKVFITSKIPLKTAVSESQILEGEAYHQDRFKLKMEGLISSLHTSGRSIDEEMNILTGQLWEKYLREFQKLKKASLNLRLLVLFIFYLPAHFFYLMHFFSKGMAL
ncbi:MAG: hypothetical protein JNM93_13870 [Bacteriovoracaceae bacterium]|nr:hypothetical protein [Bacteriovoracaceae bacterium]